MAESLRERAERYLLPVRQRHEMWRLSGQGLGAEEIAARINARVGWVESTLRYMREEPQRYLESTPQEVGWRCAVGEISREEMMEQLRSWPYTFAEHHEDVVVRGTWDEVRDLEFDGFLTREEFRELSQITRERRRELGLSR